LASLPSTRRRRPRSRREVWCLEGKIHVRKHLLRRGAEHVRHRRGRKTRENLSERSTRGPRRQSIGIPLRHGWIPCASDDPTRTGSTRVFSTSERPFDCTRLRLVALHLYCETRHLASYRVY